MNARFISGRGNHFKIVNCELCLHIVSILQHTQNGPWITEYMKWKNVICRFFQEIRFEMFLTPPWSLKNNSVFFRWANKVNYEDIFMLKFHCFGRNVMHIHHLQQIQIENEINVFVSSQEI